MSNHVYRIVCVGIIIFLFVSAKGNASYTNILDDYDRTISMDLQEAPLKDVLKIFSIQSGLNFIASEAVKDRKVTLYLENVPIKEAMEKLFKTNKLTYEYDEAANIFIVTYADDINEPELITKVYQLKHRGVASSTFEKERLNLNSGTAVTSGAFVSGETQTNQVGTEAGTTILEAVKSLLSRYGKATEDSKTNSIVVTDIPSKFPAIDQLIAKLDVPQPQVMLEVEMLDVSKDALDALGLNIGNMENPNPMTLIIGHNKNSIFFGDTTKRGATIKTSGIGGNIVFGSTYSMILDFLTKQRDTKFLARPRILTLNNETAEIGITKDEIVNIKREQEATEAGITTTYTYERATDLKLTPEGIGIFLRVTPQINLETGEITLVVNPKTSSTTRVSEITGELVRDPEVRSTKSIVKLKDGETVVLGGLIHQEKDQTRTKVPILGDIPFVGALFRHKQTDKNIDRELLVFITPHIVKEQGVSSPRPAIKNMSGALSFAPSDRRQAIVNMLNTFERERNPYGQRKISEVGGAFN
ncbi:MAG: hypothetical protein N2606_00810 [Candidatus Omnitrophica bacterium]|nr:hypothetical protein [Candidatus Omnitrophota bacterium]